MMLESSNPSSWIHVLSLKSQLVEWPTTPTNQSSSSLVSSFKLAVGSENKVLLCTESNHPHMCTRLYLPTEGCKAVNILMLGTCGACQTLMVKTGTESMQTPIPLSTSSKDDREVWLLLVPRKWVGSDIHHVLPLAIKHSRIPL
ncbi:hypothetical protein VNO77_03632 [Canavalia gladiata]|uniref:Uncharacterized protein n=1 Tax=Canavalia gladiata TaxID=3824 RepID=A0AAN9R705_CANGL